MDPGRPKQPISTEMPTPGQSGLETSGAEPLRATDQTEHWTDVRLAQVTGEMGAFRASSASTSTALASLSSQVAALTDLVTSLLPARAPEFPLLFLLRPPRNYLWIPGGNRRCLLPNRMPGSSTAAEGSQGSVSCVSAIKLPGSGPTGPVSRSSCPP